MEAKSSALRWRMLPWPCTLTHLPHSLQLLLLVFVGSLQFLHLPLQLLLLSQKLLAELLPTLPGLFVWWRAAQLQQMDGRMNGYKRWMRPKWEIMLFFVSTTQMTQWEEHQSQIQCGFCFC
jgi:hypothetical protein